jgi:hypothetical protein
MPATSACRTLTENPYSIDWARRPKVRTQTNFRAFSSFDTPKDHDYDQDVWEKTIALVKLPEPSPTAQKIKFQQLAEEWRRETAIYSSLTKKVLHPSYQRIIGMGPAAIPLILQEMKVRPGHWFWALDAITDGESPAQGCDDPVEATLAWIQWGETKGYLKVEESDYSTTTR